MSLQQEQLQALVDYARAHHVGADQLAELVYEQAQSVASQSHLDGQSPTQAHGVADIEAERINRLGEVAQVRYLLSQRDGDWLAEQIDRLAAQAPVG